MRKGRFAWWIIAGLSLGVSAAFWFFLPKQRINTNTYQIVYMTNGRTATIVKASDQVYSPEDSIAIGTTQVAFWQDLRGDSKITAAIKEKEGK